MTDDIIGHDNGSMSIVMPTNPHSELIKRAKATCREYGTLVLFAGDLVNPDGPALAEAIQSLQGENERLREGLVKARDRFLEYEQLHLAKLRPKPPEVFYENAWIGECEDIRAKATRNSEIANELSTLLGDS